ncbi:MAG: hypothetical protein E7576_15655 [Ruminococcaceae bacterium]|nr:hypothetical protein [Oscillospiraceae bacterium]
MKKIHRKALFAITIMFILAMTMVGCSSPIETIEISFENGSYEEGLKAFRDTELHGEDLEKLAVSMREQIDRAIESYNNDLTDYDNVNNLIASVLKMDISDLNSYLIEASHTINLLKTSKNYYQRGMECVQNEDYIAAIGYFAKVIGEDYDYRNAAEETERAAYQYVENTIKTVDSLTENSNFRQVIAELNNAKYNMQSISAFTETQKARIKDKYVETILKEVDLSIVNKAYPDAIELLSNNKNDISELVDYNNKWNDVFDLYIEDIMSELEQYDRNGDFESSVRTIESALQFLSRYSNTENQKYEILSKYEATVYQWIRKYIAENQYDEAEHIMQLYIDDESIKDRTTYDTLTQEINDSKNQYLYEEERDGVLAEAAQYASAGLLEDAIVVLNTFTEKYAAADESIVSKRAMYEQEYVNRMLETGNRFYNEGKYLKALWFLEECSKIVPANEFSLLIEKINSVKPTYLCELKYQESGRYKEVMGDPLTDTLGNNYHSEDLNLFEIAVEDGTVGYAEYYLGYQYNTLHCVVSCDDRSYSNSQGEFKISGDGYTLYSIQLDRKTIPTTIDIDVSGVRYLRISLDVNWSINKKIVYCILSDCYLRKLSSGESAEVQSEVNSVVETRVDTDNPYIFAYMKSGIANWEFIQMDTYGDTIINATEKIWASEESQGLIQSYSIWNSPWGLCIYVRENTGNSYYIFSLDEIRGVITSLGISEYDVPSNSQQE